MTSKISMTLSQSTGSWLNGCLQPQHHFVHLRLNDPNGKILADVALSFEQATRMLLYNGEVECTLQDYRDEQGKLAKETVPRPETVHKRMKNRLGEYSENILARIEDVKKDLYDILNGNTKAGKKNIEKLLNDVGTIKSHIVGNMDFTVQQAEEELVKMQSDILGQIGTFIQSKTGVELPKEKLTSLLHISDDPLLIGESITPTIEPYKSKERIEKNIDDMTAMELADRINIILGKLEKTKVRVPGDTNISKLYCAQAYVSATGTNKKRVAVRYVSFQGTHILELDEARAYLRFLMTIRTYDEFKTHSSLEVEVAKRKMEILNMEVLNEENPPIDSGDK